MDDEQADERDPTLDPKLLHDTMLEMTRAVQARFGDREPSDEELRAFLRQRLIDEGKSESEADAVLREL